MSDVSQEELIDIATKLAQTIQDVIDEAEEAGCDDPFPDFRLLLEEWEAIYKRCGVSWQAQLMDSDDNHEEQLLCI